MGCDIHIFPERCDDGKHSVINIKENLLGERSYRIFGFLAGVRNYSGTVPISERRGLPKDVSQEVIEDIESSCFYPHSASWLSMQELAEFDYNQMTEDRRCAREVTMANGFSYLDGGSTCDPGEGEVMTYRDFLGEYFFKQLDRLREIGTERVVFYFDN